ncbi:hypothetical protein SPONN_1054 [uncultured Candidatus Thioglobus sp.]|nr:hypothetical protein SPONN_1054 [uncultured Candidatus Thioglobus sp.]
MYVQHLNKQHDFTASIESKTFVSMCEFNVWRRQIEASTCSYYVKKTATKQCGNTNHIYLYCNRSGKFFPRGKGKRSLKIQGSSKIGDVCSSYIKVTEKCDDGNVQVEYCSTHNHEKKLAHLPIPDDTRKMIAGKLQLGVKIERIMDDIRYRAANGVGRQHLINRQDIVNIQHKLNIGSVRKHCEDQASVCAWVEELRGMTYDPILLFKPQGSILKGVAVGKDDFLLAFQTELQHDLLLLYGNNIVCMDATHGTNMYDFYLITVLVVDSHGEGLPVAWLISNHEDTTHITVFLQALKDGVGQVHPKVFMSDDADQYFNSWCSVFGRDGVKKLLCAWHVDRAWRKNLNMLCK